MLEADVGADGRSEDEVDELDAKESEGERESCLFVRTCESPTIRHQT